MFFKEGTNFMFETVLILSSLYNYHADDVSADRGKKYLKYN